MFNPFVFQPGRPVATIAHVFGAAVKIQGLSWLPVNQLLAWAWFAWQSLQKHASWPLCKHLGLGGLRMLVFLGSEWCHNLAHVAAARAVGQPVDALRIFMGMPVLMYDEPEHPSITPKQHIIRSAAGPLCNFILLSAAWLFQRASRPGSAARDIADTAVGMNSFIAGGALLPVPVFDGGPIAKWSLIGRGVSPARSAALIRRANRVIGPGLAGAAVAAVYKRSWWLALILSFMGYVSLSVGFGQAERPSNPPRQEAQGILLERG
jgi:Zn-dependent protease